jgi:hypothetical protein
MTRCSNQLPLRRRAVEFEPARKRGTQPHGTVQFVNGVALLQIRGNPIDDSGYDAAPQGCYRSPHGRKPMKAYRFISRIRK